MKDKKIPACIPVSASRYQVVDEQLSYNKDSDQWYCICGNETVKVHTSSQMVRGAEYTKPVYTFEATQCQSCPRREKCMQNQMGKAKQFQVTANAPEYYAHSQWAKRKRFSKDIANVPESSPRTPSRNATLVWPKPTGLTYLALPCKLSSSPKQPI